MKHSLFANTKDTFLKSETTDGAQFDSLLAVISGLGRDLFYLFQVRLFEND